MRRWGRRREGEEDEKDEDEDPARVLHCPCSPVLKDNLILTTPNPSGGVWIVGANELTDSEAEGSINEQALANKALKMKVGRPCGA